MIIKRQFKEKLGHMQKIIVCGYVILNLSRNLTFLLSGRQREETSRSISLYKRFSNSFITEKLCVCPTLLYTCLKP